MSSQERAGEWEGSTQGNERATNAMEDAKAKLSSLISEKRRNPDNGKTWEEAFLSTFDCLERLGIGNDTISKELNVIHIAGTKVSRDAPPAPRSEGVPPSHRATAISNASSRSPIPVVVPFSPPCRAREARARFASPF